MKKRFLLVAILILISFNLTGCGIFDSITEYFNEKKEKATVNNVVDTLTDSLGMSMGNRSSEAMDRLRDNLDTYNEWQTKEKDQVGILESWAHGHLFRKNYIEKQQEKSYAQLEKQQSTVQRLLDSDPIYKKDKESRGLSGLFSNQKKSGKVPTLLIVIIVVVLLIIIGVVLLNKRANTPPAGYVPKSQRQPKPDPNKHTKPTVDEVKQTGAVKADNVALCQKMCKQRSLDYNEELKKCGGNTDQLLNYLLKMPAQ